MDICLTSEQSQIVSDNHSLIYWYINLKHLDINEWYDLLAIELCYTVANYDPEKGSLSNYYKMRADNLVRKEYSKTQLQKNFNNGLVSLDENTGGYIENDLEELIKIQELLDSDYGEILRLKSEGYSQLEIAEKFGVTQSYISKIIERKRREYFD